MLTSFDELDVMYEKMSEEERKIFDSFFVGYFGVDVKQYSQLCLETANQTSNYLQTTSDALQKRTKLEQQLFSKLADLVESSEGLLAKTQEAEQTIKDNKNIQILADYPTNNLDG